MDYKRACRVLGIILIISIILVMGYIIIDSFIQRDTIKRNIDITAEEKEKINYNQLIADIKYVENGRSLKHAKEIEDKNNTSQILGNEVQYGKTYYGDGYTVYRPDVTDVIMYEFYVNGRCVHVSQIGGFEKASGVAAMTKQTKEILLLIIVAIMGVVEILFYINYKKQSKNNKNIEEKKSV